jgi:hypothetical protein
MCGKASPFREPSLDLRARLCLAIGRSPENLESRSRKGRAFPHIKRQAARTLYNKNQSLVSDDLQMQLGQLFLIDFSRGIDHQVLC